MLDRLRPIWPLIAAAVSAALLAGAHAFERFGGLYPCPLCLDQRNWHWGVLALGLGAFIAIRLKPALARWAGALIGLALLGSFAQAGYHVAVEQGLVMAQCDARIDLDDLGPLDFQGPLVAPKCDEIAWSLYGVSMAGYNALISAFMALASFAIALWPARKS